MKIATATVLMASRHKSETSAAVTESLTVSGRLARAEAERNTRLDAVRISAARMLSTASLNSAEKPAESPYEISDEEKLKISLIEEFIRQLTGKDFKIRIPDKLIRDDGTAVQPQAASVPQASGSLGFGIEYNKTAAMTQSESTAFQAAALLTTDDGRQISAQISLALKKSTTVVESTAIRLGNAKTVDPLVLNFAAASASASISKFAFDLNVDGKNEQISFVGPGSGLLALDRNGDGAINNGDELFGPQSGNGFHDLSKLDEDSNQWIDENDSIYDHLQIWVKDENGADRLFALAEKGVGAIYLGNVETPFTLENAGSIDANIRRTGIFVREDGTAGTIQHVDMVV
jgi:hypothetical protein